MTTWAAIPAIFAPRLSTKTHNAHYVIARDMRLFRIAAHIVRRLTEEGWDDVNVCEDELLTYRVSATKQRQDGKTLGCWHRVGRGTLLDYGMDIAELLVWLFKKSWKREDRCSEESF